MNPFHHRDPGSAALRSAVLVALPLLFLPTQPRGTSRLEWATYLGGSDGDRVLELVRTPEGEIVLLGNTLSLDFPTTVGPAHSGGYDVFVAVLDASGSSLLYSTLLGGTGNDFGYDMQIGSNGNLYIAGLTESTDFPTTPNAWLPTFQGGNWDGFVVELALGETPPIKYGTYLGGSSFDCAGGLQVRAPRVLTIAGSTRSVDFPVTSEIAVQPTNAGGSSDYFLCRLDLDQTPPLQYGTYLGGTAGDGVTNGIAITLKDPRIHEAPSGVVTLAGRTRSDDIVRTGVGYDSSFNSLSSADEDGYLAIVDPSRSGTDGLLYDTYLGGTLRDGVRALAVDSAGVVTLGGWTDSPAFPTTPGAFGRTFIGPTGRHDGFVSRLDPGRPPGAQQLVYSTLLSGDGWENVTDLVLDGSGRVLAQGYSGAVGLVSNSFPTTRSAFQRTFAGEWDGFLVHLDPAGNGAGDLSYSTFLGGSDWDIRAFGLEVLYESPTLLRVLSAGGSRPGFPTTSGVYQPNPIGIEDGLVLQLEIVHRKSSFRRVLEPIASAGTRRVPLVAGAVADGPTPSVELLPSRPGDPPSLHVDGPTGAVAILWLGTQRFRDGERWIVSPNVSSRLLTLTGARSSPAGSLDVSLERLQRTSLGTPLFAQVAVLAPEGPGGFTLSSIVELVGSESATVTRCSDSQRPGSRRERESE